MFISDTLEKIAECFSVYSNFRKVMNTETGHASDTLRCVHGLRVLTMAWIILGHTFFYKNFNLGSEYLAISNKHFILDSFEVIMMHNKKNNRYAKFCNKDLKWDLLVITCIVAI